MADGMTVIRLLLESILHPSMGSGKLIVAYSSNKQFGLGRVSFYGKVI